MTGFQFTRIFRFALLCFWIGGAGGLFADDANDGLAREKASLRVWNREILTFRAKIRNQTPEDRLARASYNLRNVPEFDLFESISVDSAEMAGQQVRVFSIGDFPLFAIFEDDLVPESRGDLDLVSGNIRDRLEELRLAKLEQLKPHVFLRGLIKALAASLIYGLLAFLLRRINRFIHRRLRNRAMRLKKLTREGLDLRPTVLQLLRRLLTAVYFFTVVSLGYIWLTYCLGLFPYTSPLADQLGDLLLNGLEALLQNMFNALPGLLLVLLIFFTTRGLVRVLNQVLDNLQDSKEDNDLLGRDTARATRRIAGVLVWIAALVIAYPYIPGSDSEAFKGIGVLVGLMLSLGSSGFVNQLMSGFVVLYSGAVRSEEYVQVGDVEGRIKEIGLLSTTITTPRGERVSIPNTVFIQQKSVNYTRMSEDGRIVELHTTVTIGYDTPWQTVYEVLLEAAGRTSGIRKEPAPHVMQKALSDYYVEYELRFTPGDASKRGMILSKLHENIQNSFHRRGLQIMSPHFVSQPDEPVLPPEAAEK